MPVVLRGEVQFEQHLSCRDAAVVVAEVDALVLVGFHLNAVLQSLQDVVVVGGIQFLGVDCLVVEHILNRIVIAQGAACNIIASAVQTGTGVNELGAFLLCELLEVPLELLVLRLALTGIAYKQNTEAKYSQYLVELHSFSLKMSRKDILFFEINHLCHLINVKNMPHNIKNYGA